VSQTKPDFTQEPVVLESVHESIRYENDGSGTRELKSRIRVQTPAGLNIAGQLVFDYNAADEQLEVRSVRVLKSDGSIVAAGPEAVQDLSAPVAQGAPMYTDARQKHVTVPGLSVGDVVEYDVFLNANPILQGHFWRIWLFGTRYISLDEQLDLDVPATRPLKVTSPENVIPAISVEGGRRHYHWATSNLETPPQADLLKNFTFDVHKLLGSNRPPSPPRVMFSTFQSWTEVADWYANLERDRRVPTPEIRAKAEEITRGLQTDEAKARALYYWVSQNIRYVSLSFGVGRYQPHVAADVLANRYGDCKDKTTLLEALLDAEGLHARPVLVNLLADVDPEMPNPFQFNHTIVFLRLGNRDLWLDSTVGVGPFGYLVPQLRDTQGLVVSDPPATGLRKLPKDFPFTPESNVRVDGTIDKQGTLNAIVEFQTRGDLEVLIRLVNQNVTKEQLAKAADSLLVSTRRFLYGTVLYTDFKVLNPKEISAPVKTQFHVGGKLEYMGANSTPAQIALALGYLATQQFDSLFLPRAFGPVGSSGKEPNQLPTDFHGPRSNSLQLNLTFPDLPKSDPPPPKEFHQARDFADFQARDSWEGATFHASRSLVIRVPSIPATQSGEYAAFQKQIVEAFPVPPKSESETKPTPATAKNEPAKSKPVETKHLPSPEVQELYKRGADESQRKNWANAIEAFGSAAKADPQYPDAWRELGRAHMNARQFPDAETAFRKYLQLAPDDHLAYLNMAWVLYNERKFEEDRDLMLKRVAVAPEDGDALFRLGVAYLALHQPELAVPVLERSIVQFPKYVVAHMALSRAYLETHQDLLAQTTLRKVVTLDDSDSSLNGVAYLLAEHRAYLDLAEGWSQRSIDVVERELNNTTLSTVQSVTWTLVAKLGHYWDTMGWVKFQQGQLDTAGKYTLAAWQITDDLPISYHLGRIYEAQDRKNEAAEMYLAALSKVPTDGTLSDDAKDSRKKLSELLDSDTQVDARLAEARKRKSPLRMVSIANPGAEGGISQYTVLLNADAKVQELSSTSPDDPLAALNDAVRAAPMPQLFPDSSLKKMPRLGTLSCSSGNQQCTFTLLSVAAAARVATLE
jgi:tetratricopeptide (TPR) repeat protein